MPGQYCNLPLLNPPSIMTVMSKLSNGKELQVPCPVDPSRFGLLYRDWGGHHHEVTLEASR